MVLGWHGEPAIQSAIALLASHVRRTSTGPRRTVVSLALCAGQVVGILCQVWALRGPQGQGGVLRQVGVGVQRNQVCQGGLGPEGNGCG